ncbi:unnamed protein product [Mytilus coruscus]|uniref:SWIM-type domain-containing protein n=1 Tax=Mytilus coruscus TaxID=42192 RepID=A0A6J8C558_MYTCO|nr:unnamed protein product [Mytilus coruscus]
MNKFFMCLNVRNTSKLEKQRSRNENLNQYRDDNDELLQYLTGEFLRYFDDWKTSVENRPELLEAFDRNQDFGGQEDLGEDFSMSLPELSKYKDMNTETEFVDFKIGAVETYLEQMDKSLDCDATNLYKEKFLNQCECAAGMGPNAHCKHVCYVLIALYYFSSNGEIVTEETCTQRLQTFHKSKRFKGSPIKACDLSVSAVRASNVNFDPRPRASQNTSNYQNYFRNICLNHKYGSTLPIVQLYPPANMYGVVTDHDYFEFHPEDKWLSENCISTITDEEISKIESFTSGQAKKS